MPAMVDWMAGCQILMPVALNRIKPRGESGLGFGSPPFSCRVRYKELLFPTTPD
jgi:hypothetical protein